MRGQGGGRGGALNSIGQNCEHRGVTMRGLKTCHCGISLEFRLVRKYNGSPYVNQLSNNRGSCRCENFGEKQKNWFGKGRGSEIETI